MNDNIVFDELNTKIQKISNKFFEMNTNLNTTNNLIKSYYDKINIKQTIADSTFPAYNLASELIDLRDGGIKEICTFYTSVSSAQTCFDKGTFSFRIYYENRGGNTRLNKDYLSIKIQTNDNITTINTQTFSNFYYFNYDHVECYQTEALQLPLNSKCILSYVVNSPNSTAAIIKNGV